MANEAHWAISNSVTTLIGNLLFCIKALLCVFYNTTTNHSCPNNCLFKNLSNKIHAPNFKVQVSYGSHSVR